jgi:hypothetical protein
LLLPHRNLAFLIICRNLRFCSHVCAKRFSPLRKVLSRTTLREPPRSIAHVTAGVQPTSTPTLKKHPGTAAEKTVIYWCMAHHLALQSFQMRFNAEWRVGQSLPPER